MKENKEISALFQLIDDPDEEVYSTVSDRIISFGKDILPNLEELWENTHNVQIQTRIESLIHKLHYRDLMEATKIWKETDGSLLTGAIIIARYHYPDLQEAAIRQEIEKIRRNIWIELNPYLTPLEQVNVFNSILYNYYKQKFEEISYTRPENFLINKVLELHKGNALGNGILYISLCNMLDIPVKAVHIPRQFLMAYTDEQYALRYPNSSVAESNKFFIDPTNGQIYSHQDVENYFKRLDTIPGDKHFKARTNLQIIAFLAEELGKCFDDEPNRYKMFELIDLANFIRE